MLKYLNGLFRIGLKERKLLLGGGNQTYSRRVQFLSFDKFRREPELIDKNQK